MTILSKKNWCLYFLLWSFLDTLKITSMEMISDIDSCDADNEVALDDFIVQIQRCTSLNHNMTEQILNLNQKLEELKDKIDQIQQPSKNAIQGRMDGCEDFDRRWNQKSDLEDLKEKIEHIQQPSKIVIQRRLDGSVDFDREWFDYKLGFGNSSGEFFIGLDQLHKLTNSESYQLLIVLENWANERRFAKYDNFVVGSESTKYQLQSLGKYIGTAGDSLTSFVGQKFTTKDQDNDKYDGVNCAVLCMGAWWHYRCLSGSLNGPYKNDKDREMMLQWYTFPHSLKFVEMSIRPN